MEKYTISLFGMIQRASDNAFIPQSDDNSDYLAYLAWKDAGGVADVEQAPTPAPEPSRDQQLSDALAQLQALQAQIQALMKTTSN
jgi:hypothetical protein